MSSLGHARMKLRVGVMKSVVVTDVEIVSVATMQKSCVAAVSANEVEYSPIGLWTRRIT